MFFDDHGLLNSQPNQKNAENSFLWTLQYYILTKGKAGYREMNKRVEKSLYEAAENMRIGNGLYKQNPSYPHPSLHDHKDAYMSHDQLTALVCWFVITGQKQKIKDIVKVIVKQKGRYDNKNPETPSWSRFYHPRDTIFYFLASLTRKDLLNPFYLILGVASFSLLMVWTILVCIWYLTLLGTAFSNTKKREQPDGSIRVFKKTDGDLLYFCRRNAIPWIFAPINRLFNLAIKVRFKEGWRGVFLTYHDQPKHPIRSVINDINF